MPGPSSADAEDPAGAQLVARFADTFRVQAVNDDDGSFPQLDTAGGIFFSVTWAEGEVAKKKKKGADEEGAVKPEDVKPEALPEPATLPAPATPGTDGAAETEGEASPEKKKKKKKKPKEGEGPRAEAELETTQTM